MAITVTVINPGALTDVQKRTLEGLIADDLRHRHHSSVDFENQIIHYTHEKGLKPGEHYNATINPTRDRNGWKYAG